MSNSKKLDRLCKEQDNICFWCFRECTRKHPGRLNGGKYQHWSSQATIDHMFHKFDPIRNSIWGRFVVMACYRCNSTRNKEQQKDENVKQRQREINEAHEAQKLSIPNIDSIFGQLHQARLLTTSPSVFI